MSASTVFLGIGSNLGDSIETLRRALAELAANPKINIIQCSPIYRSRPLADMDQPDYVNGVVECASTLTPLEMLDACQSVEEKLGRVRTAERWQPRTLDIDILAFDAMLIKNSRLSVPHPGIVERDFVLYPWNDIAPDFQVPLLGTVRELKQACEDRGLERQMEPLI
ncbi:MAG: 2-amino-4-hydroxy-6-hydroxymethyldihydropteridine diphosphokinase [Gammaproteobacteria bacterium]|nr:2-amino-4-hydroxy-6-hydroxymethyldihydropteridine diphosphokinase [Gammaproteobacteria bacterium]